MNNLSPEYFKNVGQDLQKRANAIRVIAKLLHENQIKHDVEEGEDTFNGYIAGGLFNALELLAESVSEIGVDMEDRYEEAKKGAKS